MKGRNTKVEGLNTKSLIPVMIELLVENDANPFAIDKDGKTPFDIAFTNKDSRFAKALLGRNIFTTDANNFKLADGNGKTLLDKAVEGGKCDLFRDLVSLGVDPNYSAKAGPYEGRKMIEIIALAPEINEERKVGMIFGLCSKGATINQEFFGNPAIKISNDVKNFIATNPDRVNPNTSIQSQIATRIDNGTQTEIARS